MAEEIHSAWDTVKPGIEICIQSDNSDVRIEDVYWQLRNGRCQLYTATRNDIYSGFVVLVPDRDAYSGRRKLHVWLCYSLEGKNLLEEGDSELVRIAKSVNAEQITFLSPRKGFEKLVKPFGYEIAEILYTKRL